MSVLDLRGGTWSRERPNRLFARASAYARAQDSRRCWLRRSFRFLTDHPVAGVGDWDNAAPIDWLGKQPGLVSRVCGLVIVLVQVVAQRFGAGGVAQLGHRLVFDLPDALSGDPMDVADFFERAWLAVGEPESQSHNAGLSLG
jgi:hypothetical protein